MKELTDRTSYALALALIASGCVSAPPPSAAYFGPSVGPPKAVGDLEVMKSAPTRAFEDVGTIQVACPIVAQTAAGPYGSTTEAIGGCSYAHALLLAQQKVAEAGADGLYGVETSAAANGNIVSLTAAVFRFRAAEAEQREPVAPNNLEQRLRTLKELHEKGLISDEDFAAKKAEILKEI